MIDFSPLWISLRIAIIATFITGVFGTAAAHFMQRYRGRWRSLLESLFLAPMVLPPTVLGFLLLLLLGRNGPLGALLSYADINVVFTWYAAILTATVVAFPLMYRATLGAFEQIDSHLQQVARTLGASECTVFRRITLPLAFPGLLAGLTLAFARALGEFGATLMLAGNIPGQTQTLPMAIYFAVEGGDLRAAALWSAVVLGIALTGIFLVNGSTGYQHRQQQSEFFKRVCNNFFSQAVRKLTYRHDLLSKRENSKSHTAIAAKSLPYLVVNIRKRLSSYVLAVEFVVKEQQPLGILGASGAGKSLLLRCVAGIETPDTGRIVLNGRVLFDSEQGIDLPSCDRNIGILFQNYALFPHLTVAENIAFALSPTLSPAQKRASITQQLVAVQLETFSQRYPHELSGGQQQRAALARALASQPQVLLLDEPFSALDTHLRSQIERQLIARLRSYHGVTLLVTHNLEEAYRVCDQLLVLGDGSLLAHDNKQSIFENPGTVRIAQLTGCKNFSSAVAIGEKRIAAQHWQCQLETVEFVSPDITQVSIRADRMSFLEDREISPVSLSNTFHCWLATTSETPDRMTLYLKLHKPPSSEQDYHLQADVARAKWHRLKERPLPWTVRLDPVHLLLLTN